MLVPQQYLPGMLAESSTVSHAFFQYLDTYSSIVPVGGSQVAFRFHLTCLAFWRTVQITPDGYYLGCCMPLSSARYWEYAIGNVKEEAVDALYRKSLEPNGPLGLFYDEGIVSDCKEQSCFRQCFGGCRTFTHIRTNRWTGPHPSCQERSDNKEFRRTPHYEE